VHSSKKEQLLCFCECKGPTQDATLQVHLTSTRSYFVFSSLLTFVLLIANVVGMRRVFRSLRAAARVAPAAIKTSVLRLSRSMEVVRTPFQRSIGPTSLEKGARSGLASSFSDAPSQVCDGSPPHNVPQQQTLVNSGGHGTPSTLVLHIHAPSEAAPVRSVMPAPVQSTNVALAATAVAAACGTGLRSFGPLSGAATQPGAADISAATLLGSSTGDALRTIAGDERSMLEASRATAATQRLLRSQQSSSSLRRIPRMCLIAEFAGDIQDVALSGQASSKGDFDHAATVQAGPICQTARSPVDA
jgi:hypothetical protein